MDAVWLPMLPFLAALAFVLVYALRRVECPKCGDPLPPFRSPFQKSRRMWRAGGYRCARCGCEATAAGREVTADTPPALFPARQWAAVAVLLGAGVGLGASVALTGPPAAPPPVVALPQQAPALAPPN
jgi:DNA-directed RNA polymerase subunit RPC12/RpoP